MRKHTCVAAAAVKIISTRECEHCNPPSDMQRRGDSPSLPIVWPEGAWAHLRIKRPLNYDQEKYLYRDDVNIGRNESLTADGFRIDLQQVVSPALADLHVCAMFEPCRSLTRSEFRRSAAFTAVCAKGRAEMRPPSCTKGAAPQLLLRLPTHILQQV